MKDFIQFIALFPKELQELMGEAIEILHNNYINTYDRGVKIFGIKETKVEFDVMRPVDPSYMSFGVKVTFDIKGKTDWLGHYYSISVKETEERHKKAYEIVQELITQKELGGVK